jgi:ADP-dependent phosphofructokinase/glucokinase
MVAEYDSILLMANAYGITGSTARYRVFTGKVYDGLIFKLKDKDAQIPIPKSFTKKKVDYKKNTELDREKYAILKYETKHHICITPCPYFESPKPMVGSGRCLNCSCFRGRNQETQEIACNKSLR